MAMSGGKDDGSPMMEINTTPLIDVMLVLLIMFIITIPVATHSVDIDLPVSNDTPNDPPPVDPVKNKVVLTQDNKILWNDHRRTAPRQSQAVADLAGRAGTAVRARGKRCL